jgi:hypothetical protein
MTDTWYMPYPTLLNCIEHVVALLTELHDAYILVAFVYFVFKSKIVRSKRMATQKVVRGVLHSQDAD